MSGSLSPSDHSTMASSIPRAVSSKKMRLGQQMAVLQMKGPHLPSVKTLRLVYGKRPGAHVGARKFARLDLPAIMRANEKLSTSVEVDYSKDKANQSKPTLKITTEGGESVEIDLSGLHSSAIMTRLQQAAVDPKGFNDSLTPVQPKSTAA